MTDPAEIRAEGRRLLERYETSDPIWERPTPKTVERWFWEHADVLLADPAPVGRCPECGQFESHHSGCSLIDHPAPVGLPAEERALRWCKTHSHPAWQYEDGSITCMYDLIAETREDHVLGARLSLGVAGDFCSGCEACQPIDRLSAAPVDDLEREALERIIVAMERVTPCPWCSEDNNPSECPTAIARNALAVPLSPSVDPEEEP